jgi:anti-sigma factor RsiW
VKSWLARVPGTRAWRKRRDHELCKATRARLQEIVDGEVPPGRVRSALLRHLRACERCGAEAIAIEALKQAIDRVTRAGAQELARRLEQAARELLASPPGPRQNHP